MKKQFFTKALALSLLFSSAIVLSNAQTHCITKQKTFGGSGDDAPGDNMLKVPGGIIVPGYTNSTDGNFNLPPNHGQDAFLIKYNSAGNIVWKHTYGGSGDDYFIWASATADGGIVAIGGTYSNDGDVSGNHGNEDVWVVKTNSYGDIQWQKCYGGSGEDYGWQVLPTCYGYALVGAESSVDGNVTGNHGSGDAWYLKISHAGNILFQKTYGGTGSDDFVNIINNADGSCIVGGATASNDGDVSGNHGGESDTWILKLSASGNIIWKDVLGGSATDAFNGMAKLNDGHVVIGMTDNSNDGDVTDNHGGFDAWIVKVNQSSGNIIWKKSFGDALDQGSYGGILATADGGALSFGFDGDFTSSGFTGDDALVIKMTSNGNEQWKRTYGGSDEDDAVAGLELSPGKYLISVSSMSNDGDVHNAHGAFDGWLIELGNCGNHRDAMESENDVTLGSSPNPFSTSTSISFSVPQTENVSIKIFDMTGRMVKTLADGEMQEGVHQLEWNATDEKGNAVDAGIYFLKFDGGSYSETKKLSVIK